MPRGEHVPSAMTRVLSLLGLVGLAACSPRPPASQFPNAQAALDRMHETYACSRGQRGEAKLDYFGSGGRVRGDLWYLTYLPDKVRLDVVSPFGATISSVTSDGERFALFDLRQKSFLQGAASACNLARFTNVPMPPHALVQLLRGEAPVLVHEPNAASIEWKGGRYVVEIASRHSAHQTIELLPMEADWARPYSEQRLLVKSVAVEQLDVPLYEAKLLDHAIAKTAPPRIDPDGLDPPLPPSGPECNAPVPMRIQIEVPAADHDLRLRNQEVVHNPPLTPVAFVQEVPRGVRRETSPCDR